jgi:hypothetical protein
MSRLQHKPGRKSNYAKSLNNEYHHEVRRRVFVRDGFKCRNGGCASKLYLEAHHITYYVNGQSILGRELEDDNLKWVVTLCAKCHEKVGKNINHIWNPKNRNKTPISKFQSVCP